MTKSILSPRRRALGLLFLGLAVTGLWSIGRADPTEPSGRERQITKLVSTLLQRDHLSKHPLDQEMGRRCVAQFIKTLDPMKVYFYQSDVDAFTQRSGEVENVKKGDVSLGNAIFAAFLKRVDDRVKLVDEFLATKHEFNVDEELLIDRDSAQFPKDPTEARERWRKRIKYDLLVLKADRMDKERKAAKSKKTEGDQAEAQLTPEQEFKEDVERLNRRYHNFSKRMHQIDNDELLEMYLGALCASFDPHTTYMSADTVKNFIIQMKLQLKGIGASLQSVDGYTVVRQLISGGPAQKDGRLKVDDKIIGVGQGKEGPIQDVVDMKLSDVVKIIRGDAGTVVRLQIERGRSRERKIIDITRAEVELKESEARGKVFEAGKRADGKPFRMGFIKLPSFYMDMEGARLGLPNYRSTTRDVRQILEDFNRQGVDALVLDLRGNGGGSLQEAINTTGLFIDRGPVVQVKDSEGNIHPYNDSDAGMTWKGPMVVLIDKFSASASEILAGAIQDYGRGLILGDRSTHGKGTVQSLLDLGEQLFRLPNAPEMGSLKITMQQFYRPSGDSTQQRGVLSDIELPSLTSHLEVSEADLDYPVAFDHIDPQPFQKLSLVGQPLVQKLREQSAQRTRNSEDFRKVLRDVTRYEDQKKRKYVTLNEKKFLEERAELNADKEEEKKFEEMADPDRAEIKRDYFVNEALAITVDYLLRLSNQPQPPQAAQTQQVKSQ